METKEFKRITKYDEISVNDFVIGFVEAKKDRDNQNTELDAKIAEVDAKLAELNSKNTRKMTPEERESHKAEKEELRKEKSGYSKEKTQVKNNFAKWEKEKARIKERLNKDIEKVESKIEEKKAEIAGYEAEIKANEEKLDSMDKKSPEYDELVMANRALERKISSSKGVITKHESKITLIKEIEGNLDKDNPLDLKPKIKNEPNRENKKYKTSKERYKEYLEEKAKNTGYYAHARTAAEDASFRTLGEEEQKIKDRKAAEEIERAQREAEERTKAQKEAEEKAKAQKEAEEKAKAQKAAEEKAKAQKIAEEKAKAQKAAEEKAKAQKEAEEKTKTEPVKTAETKKVEKKTESAKTSETKKIETKAEPVNTVETKKVETKTEPVKTEQDNETARLEDEIKKSAERLREYRENGDYNKEALEHEYYNSLVSKMSNLKNKTQVEPEKNDSKATEVSKDDIATPDEIEAIIDEAVKDYNRATPDEIEAIIDEAVKDYKKPESPTNENEKQPKEGIFKRIWNYIKEIPGNIKRRFDNIGTKLLAEDNRAENNKRTKDPYDKAIKRVNKAIYKSEKKLFGKEDATKDRIKDSDDFIEKIYFTKLEIPKVEIDHAKAMDATNTKNNEEKEEATK